MFKKRLFLEENLNSYLDNPKFFQYYQFLIEVNKITNLTRITDLDSVYYKHFYDSIVLTNHIDLHNKSLLDVGAGAGFPSIPLKIIDDTLEITIIDSLNKRIKFLYDLIMKLEINNVNLIHGRAEEHKRINNYDVVTSRAVSRLNILVELTLPFVKVGGYFIAYKAMNFQEELDEALSAIEHLGGKLDRVIEYQIDHDERHVLIIIKKINKTNSKYPRNFGLIKKNPL